MALSVSRRLLRSFGSVLASGRCDSSTNLYPSSFRASLDFCGHAPGDILLSGELSAVFKPGSFFLANRRLSTSNPTPESSGGAFPSNLLSAKPVVASERSIGLCQDLVIPVTNFHYEDKGFTVLAGDVFDVPIRKDIIHRVVLWQLAKRQQGTHSTKTISEVSGTGRKPWNQKGTGRARHGTLRGPQFRGGCTMHGPKPRSHEIKLKFCGILTCLSFLIYKCMWRWDEWELLGYEGEKKKTMCVIYDIARNFILTISFSCVHMIRMIFTPFLINNENAIL
ncbi:39S ribosomal protein L4 [Pyrus ussuriensis x Pyrus communis]|uniref:Large ribosomal subunit protein uL4m n=1 Tax=Pyrus ussuriensis x Pyrus communis TaxID=2448454 RepID=A0A5N5IE68_9ROSA|nr:39S ribosomal protein L4 [Pyrus ussuriensis x Pyrus communis]